MWNAFNVFARIVSTLYGVITICLGVVWALQAFNLAFNTDGAGWASELHGEQSPMGLLRSHRRRYRSRTDRLEQSSTHAVRGLVRFHIGVAADL